MAKENKIYVIATVINKGKVVGARITDLGDRSKKFMDVSLTDMVRVYKSNPQMFKNVAVENGRLNSLGSVFTVVDFATKKPISKQYIVIANKLGNLGYTLIDYKGNVKKCNVADTLKVASSFEFSNAIVSNGVITPKTGEFLVEDIAIKRDSSIESIGAGLMIDSSKKMVGSYRADALNAVGNENIFDGLSDKQIQAIQAYYVWYTVEEYEKLSHNRTFKVKESKDIKLNDIRKDYVWYFGGIIDRGFKGNSRCTLGHPIRYEYISLGYESIKEHDTNPKNFKSRIKFGETCSSDFFLIPLDEMRKLVKIRKAMSEEIEAITTAKRKQVYENDDSAWNTLWNNVDLTRQLIDGKNLMQLTKAFGGKIANTLIMFRDLDIPFPDSLVNMACNGAYGTAKKMVSDNKAKDFWRIIVPKESKPLIDWIYSFDNDKYMNILQNYLEYMCCYCLAGNYRYDPLNNTGKRFGAMNKMTRAQRYHLISPYRNLGLSKFTYNELCNILSIMAYIRLVYDRVTPELVRVAKGLFKVKRITKLNSIDSLCKLSSSILAVSAFKLNPQDADSYFASRNILYAFKLEPSELLNLLETLSTKIDDNNLTKELEDAFHYLKGLNEFEMYLYGTHKEHKIVYSNNDVLEFGDDKATFGKYTIDLSKSIDRVENFDALALIGSLDAIKFLDKSEDTDKDTAKAENKPDEVENKPDGEAEKQLNIDRLRLAYSLVPKSSNRYEDDIVRDMFNRNLTYNKLSYKQSNIVERVINHYTKDETDDIDSDVKDNIDKILSKADSDRVFRNKLNEISRITYDVLASIKSRGYMSEKQKRHYLKALEILVSEEKNSVGGNNS